MRETATRMLAGITHSLEITATPGFQKVPPDFRRHFLMAFKEILHNAVRHAHATHIRVNAQLEAARWLVRVSDNGRGFEVAEATSGSGLKNTRLRLEQIRGAFRIETAPGRGSTICAGPWIDDRILRNSLRSVT